MRLLVFRHLGKPVEVLLAVCEGCRREGVGEFVGDPLPYRYRALDRARRERNKLRGFVGPARMSGGVGAHCLVVLAAAAIPASTSVRMKLEGHAFPLSEEARSVEAREVGAHQVFVDLDEAVLLIGSVDDG